MAEARTIGSLPVPNVQALAEIAGDQVPERYLRVEPGSDTVVAVEENDSVIPVIDLGRLIDPQSSEEECTKLGSACHDWGFFQLINHGVPGEVIEALINDVVGFLKQPLEDKKEWSQQPGSLEGYGQAFVVSENQKLDWADMLYVQVLPTASRDLRFWPTQPASFRNSIEAYSSEAVKLMFRLLEFMAKAVGAEPATLCGMFEGQTTQGMRVNFYPPCQQADRVVGLSPHSDRGVLTLLLQMCDNDVHGLQVKKDGKWFAVHALEGALIVNVGDSLEILSNGKFRSVEHRAMIHPSKERISVAMFHYPCKNLMLGPLPELVTEGDRVRYRSTSYQEFMTQFFTAKLDGRNHLERLKIE